MKSAVALAVVAVLCASGCSLGNYRVVKKTQTGGEVALLGVHDEAQEKANAYMASVCAKGFTIVEEGEAVVGTTGEARTGRGAFNTISTQTETRDKTEWRIKYQCKEAPDAKASGAIHELRVRF